MNVVLALAAFDRAHFQVSSAQERPSLMQAAGLFALDFCEQELGQRPWPVLLFDDQAVRIPLPRGESPEVWARRWLTLEPEARELVDAREPLDAREPAEAAANGLARVSSHLFHGRGQLAPLRRAVAEVRAATDGHPTVVLVFLTGNPLDAPQMLGELRDAAGDPVFWVFLTTSWDVEPLSLDGFDPPGAGPGAPADFAVIRTHGWSPWARRRRARAIRRAVSRWLRGLPVQILEPQDSAEPEPAAGPPGAGA
ncbi:hypothetical protein [Streptomyces sp. N35]|uniref:hypothetical protein n=1 Tax=Streptomyces sp. N35 TaxID=2795730 RepID=UPI0018F38018|nr:hypothetical protein [Streptomyces sp. N35]